MNNLYFSYKPMASLFLFLLAWMIAVISLFTGCSQPGPAVHSHSELFFGGIPCSVQIYEEQNTPLAKTIVDKLFERIFDRIREIDNKMSYHIPTSEINAVNAEAGKQAVRVSDDTFFVIETGLASGQLFDGRFDISVGPLVRLWGIGTEQARVPSQAEIAETLPLVNYQNVKIDNNTKEVFLTKTGMSLDLGALAKGYACDEVTRLITEIGIKGAIIDIGGNIMVLGSKEVPDQTKAGVINHEPWRVGVRHPVVEEARTDIIGILKIQDQTIVTSGLYERFYMQDGIRYHHILNTKTGYPVENSLLSVTIITRESIIADIFSTGIFTLGLEEGKRFVEGRAGMDALLITKDKEIYLTSGLEAEKFELMDENYKLIH
jgi:thiamine biosynthesis lipoprotein